MPRPAASSEALLIRKPDESFEKFCASALCVRARLF
jgi:hypothetical protein